MHVCIAYMLRKTHTHETKPGIRLQKSQHLYLEVLVYNQLISFFIKMLENYLYLSHFIGEMIMIHDL